ncbi:hypothetical protein BLNAU_8383 [Blattamonas nauphoetae]|uniref:Uncharacterized protein n=1 Tax=Blattamonas nauphoetae TaxID=2049346 RepID=A0ABQ9XYJ6_9EUKA|nr:hypothetical protein BLNAU_8383 [Blattamonas nauphoetae]
MFANPTQSSLTAASTSEHTLEGLMEEFRRCESEFKNGDETVQFKITHSVITILTSESSKMKERSEIGIRSGLLERFSERLSSNCPSTLSALLSSVIGVMVTSVSEERPRLRSDLIPSLLALSSVYSSLSSSILFLLLSLLLILDWLISMQTVRCPHQQHTRLGLFSPLFFIILTSLLFSRPYSLFICSALICVWSLLCGGRLSSMEMEGVLSSGIVERLCTRIETESGADDLLPTLLVLDRLCSGLQSHHGNEHLSDSAEDSFSLLRRCGFALSRIEQGILTLEKRVGGPIDCDEKMWNIQQQVGGMIVRHFRSSIHSTKKEIGSIGIDLAAVRREMEGEREKERKEREMEKREMEMRENEREMAAKKAEEERQREFARKTRELDEMKRMNERLIEKGHQQEEKENEERKREEEQKKKEEEEEEEKRRRNVKEGAAAIEVFQQDNFTLSGNVFTRTGEGWKTLLSHSFGAVVVRITFIIRSVGNHFFPGLITPDLTEQAKTYTNGVIGNLKGATGWVLHQSDLSVFHDGKLSHSGSACKVAAVGQRVVMEADGREGKRTLKLSQDGETQPVFFSNIPVPFRFGIQMYYTGSSVEIVSSEVLKEPAMVGGSLEVVMD